MKRPKGKTPNTTKSPSFLFYAYFKANLKANITEVEEEDEMQTEINC